MQQFSGRHTPLTYCANLTEQFGGAQIYLKREDLKPQWRAIRWNNVIGQGFCLGQTYGQKTR